MPVFTSVGRKQAKRVHARGNIRRSSQSFTFVALKITCIWVTLGTFGTTTASPALGKHTINGLVHVHTLLQLKFPAQANKTVRYGRKSNARL